jgi:hypothetical protein
VYSANTFSQNIYIFFKFADMHSYATLFLMSPQTNSTGFKSRWYGGRCSASRPFSLILSLVAATTVIPPFLAEKQMTMQTLVFQAQNKCSCFCCGKVCISSFALRYKSVGISVTIT